MSKKLEECSKDELLEIVKHLKKRKKFGIVWEDKPEQVAELCKKELPVLVQEENKKILSKKDGGTNLIIEGDNYHSLSVLNFTHANKIDVIYIDPPYNTGGKDFVYNDQYVDREDTYRHSKWLSFMAKRLVLAKRLLKSSGAIFISIDDHELVGLKMLCDEIFGEDNFLANIVWQHSIQGKNDSKSFSLHHSYVLCYAKSDKFRLKRLPREDKHNINYSNPDNDPRGAWRSGDVRSPNYRANLTYEIETPSGKKIKAPEKGWRWSKETLEEKIENKEIIFSKDESKIIRKIYLSDQLDRVAETIWFGNEVGTTREASQELKELFNGEVVFDTPKPTRLIKQILNLSGNSNAIILDFFAGSGTTGHATLQLNHEDGGTRRFILCTNNESNISDEITYPRIKNVINGYKNYDRIESNLRYFKTDFVAKSTVSDDTRYQLVQRSVDMICIREDSYEKIEDNDSFKVFSNHGHYTAILFNVDALESLKEALSKLDDKSIHLYVFSLTSDDYSQDFMGLKQSYKICPIPESILEVYRRIFRSHQWN